MVDQELLFSEALAALLTRQGHTIAGCPTTWEGVASCLDANEATDACVVTQQADSSGTEIISKTRRLARDLPIIVLSGESDLPALLGALQAGADAVCLKLDGIEEIDSVIVRTVETKQQSNHAGPTWSRAALGVANRHRPTRRSASITQKEQAVLNLLGNGASTSQIARNLGVGEATVRTHLQHLFGKFGVHSRLALVAQAVRSETVSLDDDHEIAYAR